MPGEHLMRRRIELRGPSRIANCYEIADRDAFRSTISNQRSKILCAAAVTLVMALPLSAQLASDQVPHQRTLPQSEEIRQQAENSRYSLGPIRVQPIFGLRDFGYDSNVFGTPHNPVSDWRATGSVGAHLLLPMGGKTYVRGVVNPEYTWYKKLSNRRAWGGDYGGSILGLFNRLTVEAGGASKKSVAPVSSEVLASAMGTRRDTLSRAEVKIFQRLSVFGSAQTQQQRYSTSDDQLGTLQPLERNETFFRGGVRYRFRSYVDMSVAAESGRTNFLIDTGRNNKTSAVILGLHYDLPRTFVNLAVGSRKYEPRDALSTFPSFSTTTGSYYAEHRLGAPITVDVYGHRALQYSLTTNPYYIETRNGLGATIPIGHRLGVRGFGEFGNNNYPFADPGVNVKRSDRVTAVGGGFLVRLYRKTALITVASRENYTSNIHVNDRSVFRVTTMLSLGGDTFQ